MSTLRTNAISARTGTGVISIPAGNTLQQSGLAVQTVQKLFNEHTSTTATQVYVVATNGDLSITTKLANSRILVCVSGQGYMTGANGCNVGAQRTISGVTTRVLGVDGAAGDNWMGSGNGGGVAGGDSWSTTRMILDSPNVAAGTNITYTMMVSRWTAGTIFLNAVGYTGGSTITLTEIAQ